MDFKFGITWLFDKLGYMPKIDMEVGKVNLDVKPPEFQMWPFPGVSEDFDPRPKKKQVKKPAIVKKRIALKKATTRKPKAK